MFLRETKNEYGTKVIEFKCEFCSSIFTVCPPPPKERYYKYPGCQGVDCESYSPATDMDKMFMSKEEFDKEKVVDIEVLKNRKNLKIIREPII